MIKSLRYISLCISTVLLAALCSCHSQKSATTEPAATVADQAGWQDLYVPLTFELQSPSNMSISGRATMIRDRQIHISLRFLGMEVAIIDITPEAITAIDKYHRLIVTEPIAKILADHDISISDLQDALIGNPSEDVMHKIDSTPVSVAFGPIVNTPDGSLTSYVNIAATPSGKPLRLNLRYKPEQAKWNTGRTADYRIPSDYRRIDARSLIENLKFE